MPSMTLEKALQAAIELQRAGQNGQAEKMLRQILAQHPDCAEAQHLLGVLCAQSGRNAEGIELLRRAVEREPGVATFQINLASALFGAGRIDDAIDGYRRAVAIHADSAEAWSNLGSALISKEQFAEAAQCARKALAIRRDFAEAMVVLGNALLQSGQVDDAIAEYQTAIALRPDLVAGFDNLGLALTERRRYDEALAAFDRAAALKPDSAPVWTNRAKTLRDAGRIKEAETAARRAVTLAPDLPEAHVNLGLALLNLGRIDDSIASAQRAIELRPGLSKAHNVLANALKEAGDAAGAVDEFDRAVQLRPDNPVDLSNKIYVMEFDPRSDARALLAEQRKWNTRFGERARKFIQPHGNDRSNDRRLRVGYVSPFFYDHAEAFFVVPLLEKHDRQRFEIHCYSDAIHRDAVTERMRRSVDHWHDTSRLNHAELAEQIRRDEIDILVDLTMHMALNRAEVFARKPAPIQVCWLAYPGGTGLDAMDYRISDAWIDPPGSDESVYVEKTVRLPRTWVCYDPLSDAPSAAPRADGPIRFGSLNNPCKLNEAVLRLWGQVLSEVSDSRLILQAISYEHRRKILQSFQASGIAADRIEFVDRSSRADYLRLYDRIDICLDPFPYNGITTTCDALWMGVPVVSIVGHTAAGRAGKSILENIAMGGLCANDERDFIRIAHKCAADSTSRQVLRRSLRGRITCSSLMSADAFATDMEAAYRAMWRNWQPTLQAEDQTRE